MNNRLTEDIFISNFFIAKNGILENWISEEKFQKFEKMGQPQPKFY